MARPDICTQQQAGVSIPVLHPCNQQQPYSQHHHQLQQQLLLPTATNAATSRDAASASQERM